MSAFHFRYFSVCQSNTAMKVGTDAMLLGALCSFDRPQRILDIGTGTGVLALMTAQRFANAQITGVELDADAAGDARVNFSASPWSDRLDVVESDIRSFHPAESFDGIVSNPPYFVQSSKSAYDGRNRARHTDDLPFEALTEYCARWLSDRGKAWIIVPHEASTTLMALGERSGLFLRHRISIEGKPGKTVRSILCFSRQERDPIDERFTVRRSDGTYSDAYIELTRNFHNVDLRQTGQ